MYEIEQLVETIRREGYKPVHYKFLIDSSSKQGESSHLIRSALFF